MPNNNINTNIVCHVTSSVWIRCKWWGPLQMTSLIYVQVTLHWDLNCISIPSVFFYSVLMNAGILLRNRSGRSVCRNLFTVPCHVSIQISIQNLSKCIVKLCVNYTLQTTICEPSTMNILDDGVGNLGIVIRTITSLGYFILSKNVWFEL
jgi:hypothetical protein